MKEPACTGWPRPAIDSSFPRDCVSTGWNRTRIARPSIPAKPASSEANKRFSWAAGSLDRQRTERGDRLVCCIVKIAIRVFPEAVPQRRFLRKLPAYVQKHGARRGRIDGRLVNQRHRLTFLVVDSE